MFDLKLGLAHFDLDCVKQGSDLPLLGCKGLGPGIFERTYRNDGQARLDLHTRHRVTGRGANERFLVVGVRYGFIWADKTRAKPTNWHAHLEATGAGPTPASTARHQN